MMTSHAFFEILPIIIKRYKITNHEYLCNLYTTCGINQMFKALINSHYSKGVKLPFSSRFTKFIELRKFFSIYYLPKEVSLKVAKYFVLTHNININEMFFFILAKLLLFRKRLVGLVKSIVA